MGRSFRTKVVGVTRSNRDGTPRQKVLRKCRPGEELILSREPIPEDKNAIAVRRLNGEQLGYISRELAASLAAEMDRGVVLKARILSLTGGGLIFKRTRGCNIEIERVSKRAKA